jgi:hypothetical protein
MERTMVKNELWLRSSLLWQDFSTLQGLQAGIVICKTPRKKTRSAKSGTSTKYQDTKFANLNVKICRNCESLQPRHTINSPERVEWNCTDLNPCPMIFPQSVVLLVDLVDLSTSTHSHSSSPHSLQTNMAKKYENTIMWSKQ